MRSRFITIAAAFAWAVIITPSAHAGGFEIPGAGAVDQGRGGAWYAKADSALALRYNPAALARMPTMQSIDANVSLLMYDICFDRGGTYDTHGDGTDVSGSATAGSYDTILPSAGGGTFNPYNNPGVANPRACNQKGPGPVPQLAYAFKLPSHPKLALAVGLLAPNARGSSRYGDSQGVVDTGNPDHPVGPTPTRYAVSEVSNLQVFATVGAAYAIHPRFNLGFAFGWGITKVDFASMTQAIEGSENPNDDVRTKLSATDAFVPRINVSADAEPVDGLHVMAGFQWTQSVDTHGTLTLSPNHFMNQADRELLGANVDTVLDRTRLQAGQSSVLSFGVNYGLARKGGVAGEIADGLGTQVFDIEANFNVDFHGRMDEYRVRPGASPGTNTQIMFYGLGIDAPEDIRIQKNWKNQYVVRLGGDVNIVPGVFALRAGTWYESSGITPGYAGLDFYLPRRFGATAGATVRINRFDISLAYAHVFYGDTDYREDGAAIQANAGIGEGTISNNGLIQASMNILSLGLRYHFK